MTTQSARFAPCALFAGPSIAALSVARKSSADRSFSSLLVTSRRALACARGIAWFGAALLLLAGAFSVPAAGVSAASTGAGLATAIAGGQSRRAF
jgi:hypothetical protein